MQKQFDYIRQEYLNFFYDNGIKSLTYQEIEKYFGIPLRTLKRNVPEKIKPINPGSKPLRFNITAAISFCLERINKLPQEPLQREKEYLRRYLFCNHSSDDLITLPKPVSSTKNIQALEPTFLKIPAHINKKIASFSRSEVNLLTAFLISRFYNPRSENQKQFDNAFNHLIRGLEGVEMTEQFIVKEKLQYAFMYPEKGICIHCNSKNTYFIKSERVTDFNNDNIGECNKEDKQGKKTEYLYNYICLECGCSFQLTTAELYDLEQKKKGLLIEFANEYIVKYEDVYIPKDDVISDIDTLGNTSAFDFSTYDNEDDPIKEHAFYFKNSEPSLISTDNVNPKNNMLDKINSEHHSRFIDDVKRLPKLQELCFSELKQNRKNKISYSEIARIAQVNPSSITNRYKGLSATKSKLFKEALGDLSKIKFFYLYNFNREEQFKYSFINAKFGQEKIENYVSGNGF